MTIRWACGKAPSNKKASKWGSGQTRREKVLLIKASSQVGSRQVSEQAGGQVSNQLGKQLGNQAGKRAGKQVGKQVG